MMSFVLCLGSLSGCTSNPDAVGALRAESMTGEPVVLASQYTQSFYWVRPAAETSFVLTDIPIDALLNGTAENGQVLHVELLWNPKPGQTPMDDTAINASIRFIVIAKGEVGIYGGAGFAVPVLSLNQAERQLSIRRASLELESSTPGFVDLLSPMALTGEFRAAHNATEARRLHFAISQYVTNALGRSVMVDGRDSVTLKFVPVVQ